MDVVVPWSWCGMPYPMSYSIVGHDVEGCPTVLYVSARRVSDAPCCCQSHAVRVVVVPTPRSGMSPSSSRLPDEVGPFPVGRARRGLLPWVG